MPSRTWGQYAPTHGLCAISLLNLEFAEHKIWIKTLHHGQEVSRVFQQIIVDGQGLFVSDVDYVDVADQSVLHLLLCLHGLTVELGILRD